MIGTGDTKMGRVDNAVNSWKRMRAMAAWFLVAPVLGMQ